MSISSEVSHPLDRVARRNGWDGESRDSSFANALERARRDLPQAKADGRTIAELADDLYFIQNSMLVGHTISSIRKDEKVTVEYRRATPETVADKPYIGTVIKHDLLEEMEGPNPYDRWLLTLALENGTDAITMVADNPLIEKQATATFQPDFYMNKKVRVILGPEFYAVSGDRDIRSIELI